MAEASNDYREWQAPPFSASDSSKLAWINDVAVGEGEAWLQSQSAFKDIQLGIDLIAGKSPDDLPIHRSKLSTHRLKRDIQEIVSTESDIRPFWGFMSDAKFYKRQASMLNKVGRAVYFESFFDRSLKACEQYSAVTGTGYIWPKYKRTMYGFGPGKIDYEYYGALDVLPTQMPIDRDLQEAYSVTVMKFVPIAKAHGMFPIFQTKIHPVAKRRYQGTIANKRVTLAERFIGGSVKSSFFNLYCELRYTFILDIRINTSGKEIGMGEPGTSWYYRVPYVGQSIIKRNPLNGKPFETIADVDDCRLYPRRRLQISTKDVLLYDGPPFDWHSMVPLARFEADAWPWEGLAFSLVRGGSDHQHAIDDIERGIMTVLQARLDPAMTYDVNAGINPGTIESLDPYEPRKRVGIDSSQSDKPPLDTVLPEHLLEVPESAFTFRQALMDGMDFMLGLRDITSLSKLKAIGSDAGAMEKILEVMGPTVKDMAREMERGLAVCGNITKYLIMQYMNTARVMQYVGEDGITAETLDYDPTSLVPSHFPYEGFGASQGQSSQSSIIDRARHFAENTRYIITPYSAHEIASMTRKLALLQLKKAGVKISSQTIAEAFDVPNYGTFEGDTEIEKWKDEQEVDLEFAARLQQIAGGLAAGGAGGAPGGAGGTGQAGPGRPDTNARPPQIKQKDGGTRSTISTSG